MEQDRRTERHVSEIDSGSICHANALGRALFTECIRGRRKICSTTERLRELARQELANPSDAEQEGFALGYRDAENEYLRELFSMSVSYIEAEGLPDSSVKHELVVARDYINW